MNMPLNIAEQAIVQHNLTDEIICQGLLNPRGIGLSASGDLLLVEAGAGELTPPFSGRLTLRDRQTGVIKKTWLSGFRSFNMQSRMLRDEIMGLADLAPTLEGASSWLVSVTDYIDGSKIIETDGTENRLLFQTKGNVNSLCYHPIRKSWYCIKPDTNEVVEFTRDKPERVVCVLPLLDSGQEAVPVNIVYQPSTGHLLISLFSGELGRGKQYQGIDFAKQQGAIISVAPQNGDLNFVVTGLTLPTALCLDEAENLFITELCDDFLQPLPANQTPEQSMHGGFKRFSGRLLKIDIKKPKVLVLSTGLDTPSNLLVCEKNIYICEGMGLPGRLIPKNSEITQLQGQLRCLYFS